MNLLPNRSPGLAASGNTLHPNTFYAGDLIHTVDVCGFGDLTSVRPLHKIRECCVARLKYVPLLETPITRLQQAGSNFVTWAALLSGNPEVT